jgi:hypothetical protein
MAAEIAYLSYSSINLWLTCSEAWRRRYVAKEPQSSTPSLLFGTAIHNTIENNIAIHASTGASVLLPDMWKENWGAAVEREPNCEWGADTPEQHYNEGLRLLANPELQQMVNRLTPLRDDSGLFMERKVELRVPGVPVPIIGYIDIVTNDGVPGDFKTSAQQWSQEKAKSQLQALVYLAALNQMGKPSPGMRFRHFVIVKTKQPKVQMIETQHTIDSIWRAIESESFVPNPDAWLCKPQFCNAWSRCIGKGL